MSFLSVFLRSAAGASLAAFALVAVCVAFPVPRIQVDIGHLVLTVIMTGIGFGLGYSCWYIDREPTFKGSFLIGCVFFGFSAIGALLGALSKGVDVFLLTLALVPVLGLLIGGSAFIAVKLGRGTGKRVK